ncbi:HAD-IIB family hydrolase [Feifania hominis]|uniref:HAD-IIB family hydrolase n=1 Tax=Feifania hominis TaxID=2763660 RepID=A0A926DC90_9FIRM|nr:HAD-IIB family hydrolase [Feifania hominis]MBC8535438.1 HAD-IIB family hydrolase [Feifania hominis]
MYQGAVFLDADGTMLDETCGICSPTAKTLEAIAALRARGYLVALATGRAKCYIPEGLLCFESYITTNGAHAEVAGVSIWDDTIAPDALDRLLAFLEGAGINYIIESQQICFVKDPNETYYRRMAQLFRLDTSKFLPLEDPHAIAVNKLMITYDSPQKLERFHREFDDLYEITDQPGNYSCDVGKRGINKGVAIEKLLAHYGIDRRCTYAFGDADNDYDMLRTVGTGVMMARHSKRLEQVCSLVTDSVRDEGVWRGLVRLGLI